MGVFEAKKLIIELPTVVDALSSRAVSCRDVPSWPTDPQLCYVWVLGRLNSL
jgi:hypothetical protein